MEQMSAKEMEEKKKKVLSMCICKGCPSYVDCNELGFCFPTIGKSKCIKEEMGCLCPICPVTEMMGFTHVYYCTRGSEKEQVG